MSLTLDDLQARAALCLGDVTHLIWTPDLLSEAARHALAAYAVVTGAAVTVQGLDGAEQTSLPGEDCELIVQGTAAYAAHLRVAARSEAYALSPQTLPIMAAWARAALDAYGARLESARRRGLNQSEQVPYSAWEVEI